MQVRRFRRRAFTLIEMLVVVAIIVVLISLTTAAVMRFRGVGTGSATKTNMGKIHAKLTDQWRGVTDAANKDALSHPTNAAYSSKAGANLADEQTRKNYVLLRQRQAFPTNFNEAFWPDASWKPGAPQATAPFAWQGYVKFLGDLGVTPANEATWGTLSPDVQASVCLLMILEVGPKNGGATADDVGSAVTQIQFGTGKTKAVADAWQRPVLFTRNYNGSATPSLAIVSSGGDGKFGVNVATLAVTNPADAFDNVVVSNP